MEAIVSAGRCLLVITCPGPGQPPGQYGPGTGHALDVGRVSAGQDNCEEFSAILLHLQHLKFLNCKSFLVVSRLIHHQTDSLMDNWWFRTCPYHVTATVRTVSCRSFAFIHLMDSVTSVYRQWATPLHTILGLSFWFVLVLTCPTVNEMIWQNVTAYYGDKFSVRSIQSSCLHNPVE